MSKKLKIALAQLEVKPQSLANNVDVACAWIDKAADAGAELVLFPEIHLSSFFPQYSGRRDLAIPMSLSSREMSQLRDHCKKREIAGVPNVYLEEGNGFYDASVVIDSQGDVLDVGKMVHIADQPLFYEQDYYTPSNTGFRVVTVAGVRVGIVVCFDRHYAESFRACAKQGAELILIPTVNTKTEPLDIFEAELRAAAYQNNVFIAMANRVGQEDAMHFAGESIVVDPEGGVMHKADDQERLVTVTLDLSMVAQARQRRPYLSLLKPYRYE
ncbi:MAG: carbon-nitrogen hydrolase family protein [Rhizobacter sp.]|nr:carbon-nitrogen hydrolase family protein [Rhizobacter sp.]